MRYRWSAAAPVTVELRLDRIQPVHRRRFVVDDLPAANEFLNRQHRGAVEPEEVAVERNHDGRLVERNSGHNRLGRRIRLNRDVFHPLGCREARKRVFLDRCEGGRVRSAHSRIGGLRRCLTSFAGSEHGR